MTVQKKKTKSTTTGTYQLPTQLFVIPGHWNRLKLGPQLSNINEVSTSPALITQDRGGGAWS